MTGGAGSRGVILLGLALSALCLAVAPAFLEDGYSIIRHATSESAAQGVDSGWIARVGLLLFGSSVLALVGKAVGWRISRWCFYWFGAMLALSAVASTRSWIPDAGFDATEDLVHSIAATSLGFAFAFGVLARVFERRSKERRLLIRDLAALLASVLIPLAMVAEPEIAGLLQRAMFAIAYGWFALEVVGEPGTFEPGDDPGKGARPI